MDLGDWQKLDLLKYRIDSIKFGTLAQKFSKHYGVNKDRLKLMIANLGVIASDDELEIFYVVTKDAYDVAKKAANIGQRVYKEPEAAMLFGASPALGISYDLCKAKFERMTQEHNA